MKKLFGKNVKPSCVYCERAKKDNTKEIFCAKKMMYIKKDKKEKCKHYKYDPYKREPMPLFFELPLHKKEEFYL